MAKKMRKSIAKQKDRVVQASKPQQQQVYVPTDAALRDQYLYKSSLKAFVLAAVMLVIMIWCVVPITPFDMLLEASDVALQAVAGGLGVGFFTFTMIAWGNALEIKGNVLEWKHILVLLVATLVVVTWTGVLAFAIGVGGMFGAIAFAWQATK